MGQVMRCSVCGAEITVIRLGGGELAPHCCNKPMDSVEEVQEMFVCPVCGSQVARVRRGEGVMRIVCCNREMDRIN